MPGFRDCFVVDVAPQLGIRQTRLLEGLYVVTKEDVTEAPRTSPTAWRAAATTTRPTARCCRASVDGLIVAGRHYSATSSAQRMSREIPPCMAMGEAAGEAAALALDGGVALDASMSASCRRALRAQGADPGDQTGRSRRAGDRHRPARGRMNDRSPSEPAALRHKRARLHAGHDGTVRHPDAGRLRRRRHQDRAAGRRRPVPLDLRWPTIRRAQQPGVLQPQPQQALVALDLRGEAGKAVVDDAVPTPTSW